MLTKAFGQSTMSRTQVQLWYNRFMEGQEDVNEDARSGRASTSTTNENIEAVKNDWIIIESLLERLLMMLAYRSAHAKNFYGCFRPATCDSKDSVKIAKFCAKRTSHGHRSGNVDEVQCRSRFAQKGRNW